MAKLSKSDAARIIGVTRQTLYRYLAQGRISPLPDGTIDTAELLRAGFELQDVTVTGDDTPHRHMRRDVTPLVTPPSETALLHQMIALLQRELEEARERERAGREREALVLHMLEQAQLQSQRLLDMPRQTPATSPRPSLSGARPGHSVLQAMPEPWQQILTYMQQHPGPQRSQDIQRALGRRELLRHIMRQMVEAGVLQQVEAGVYQLS
jgi:hypothetical protein